MNTADRLFKVNSIDSCLIEDLESIFSTEISSAVILELLMSEVSCLTGRCVTIISLDLTAPNCSEIWESRKSNVIETSPVEGSISFPSFINEISYKSEDSLSTTHSFFFSYASIKAS